MFGLGKRKNKKQQKGSISGRKQQQRINPNVMQFTNQPFTHPYQGTTLNPVQPPMQMQQRNPQQQAPRPMQQPVQTPVQIPVQPLQAPSQMQAAYQQPAQFANMQPRQIDPFVQMKLEINKIVPKRRGGAWSGLEFRPKKVRFANQNKDETIYVIVRRHWSTNIGWMIRNTFYALVPLVLLVAYQFTDLNIEALTFDFIFILTLFYYSVIVTNVFRDYFDWYYDPYIVTDQRIIHYEFTPFSSYDIKETDLRSIEYVQEKSSGPLAGFFDYGDIIVTTASERAKFKFVKVPESTLVRDVISDLQRVARRYGIR